MDLGPRGIDQNDLNTVWIGWWATRLIVHNEKEHGTIEDIPSKLED